MIRNDEMVIIGVRELKWIALKVDAQGTKREPGD